MKIGELSKQTGMSIDAIRYYEKRSLIPTAARSMSGYRHYTHQDVSRLLFIVQAKGLGFTLDEIGQLLAISSGERTCDEVKQVALAKAEDIEARIRKLTRMHTILTTLAEQCEQTREADACPILDMLENKS